MPQASPTALQRDEGEAFWFLDYLVILKATGATTGGRCTIIDHVARQGSGTPLHLHTREDEWFYIQEGTLRFWVADSVVDAKSGAFLYGPKGVPHAFQVTSPNARFLVGAEPAGFENFVRALAVPAKTFTLPPPPEGPPDFEKLARVASEHGIEILGPPPWTTN